MKSISRKLACLAVVLFAALLVVAPADARRKAKVPVSQGAWGATGSEGATLSFTVAGRKIVDLNATAVLSCHSVPSLNSQDVVFHIAGTDIPQVRIRRNGGASTRFKHADGDRNVDIIASFELKRSRGQASLTLAFTRTDSSGTEYCNGYATSFPQRT